MAIDQSNYEACVARIAARGNLGQKEARDLFDELYNESERLKAGGTDNPVAQAAWNLSRDLEEKAHVANLVTMADAAKRNAVIDHTTKGGTTIRGGLHRLLYRLVWGPDVGPKENADTLGKMLARDWASAFLHEVGANFPMLRDPTKLIPIERQLYKLHAGQPVDPGAEGEVATAIYRLQETMRQRLNGAIGAPVIKNADDLSYSMSHDPEMIRQGGRDQPMTPELEDAFRAWRDFVVDRLAQKTWDRVTIPEGMTEAEARQDFLRKTFNSLLNDVHKTFQDEEPGGSPYFQGTYNMARAMSHERTLFWKDGEAAGEYRARYGSDRSWGAILGNDVYANARRAGLMQIFGSNPAGQMNLAIRRAEEMFKDRDPDGVSKFQDQQRSYRLMNIRSLMSRLDGTADQPANKMLAQALNTAMQWEDMSMLGNVSLTHLAGLALTTPIEARWSGIGTIESLGKMMGGMFPKDMPKADLDAALAEIHALSGGMASVMHDFRGNGWTFPGITSAMNHYFQTATGLRWILNRARDRGFAWMTASNLASNIGKDFENLNGRLQKTLMQYGIGPDVWNVLKTGDLHALPNGGKLLAPSIAKTVDASAITDMLRARGTIDSKTSAERIGQLVAQTRQDIADRIGMYYTDTVNHGIVTPDVSTREQMSNLPFIGGSPAMLQFKAWPTAFVTQKLLQTWYQSNSLRDAAGAFGTMLTIGMISGYLKNTAADLAAGREPRIPRTTGEALKIGVGALMSSGGLGIFGDALFGEINRMGAFGTSAIGGPLATDVGRLSKMWYDAIEDKQSGESSVFWPEMARFATDHLPGVNLFYLKDALDYGLLYHTYEAMHPGWWERSNRQMEREQGRHMIGYGTYQP